MKHVSDVQKLGPHPMFGFFVMSVPMLKILDQELIRVVPSELLLKLKGLFTVQQF